MGASRPARACEKHAQVLFGRGKPVVYAPTRVRLGRHGVDHLVGRGLLETLLP